MESWTEVNVEPVTSHDPSLLTGLVDTLVHDIFREDVETWFFFWEPALRLRFRWIDQSRVDEHRERLASQLDEAKAQGSIVDWYEGAHGHRNERYTGEAEDYGEEVWPRVQKDWMNGSEFALLLTKQDQAGALSHPRQHHWSRHVHLFTNQLYGTWNEEIDLCLAQAGGYMQLVIDGGGKVPGETNAKIARLSALASRRT